MVAHTTLLEIPCHNSITIYGPHREKTWPRGYKTFFMLNSTEHEISTAHKIKNKDFSCFQTLRCCIYQIIMLINIKMPTIVGILILISWINFVLFWVEHGKSFRTSGLLDNIEKFQETFKLSFEYTQKNNWRILKFFWLYNIWEYKFQINYFFHW